MIKIIYLTGPQGSGKTTLAHALESTRVIELEKDSLPNYVNTQNIRKAYKGLIITQQEPSADILKTLRGMAEKVTRTTGRTVKVFHLKLEL